MELNKRYSHGLQTLMLVDPQLESTIGQFTFSSRALLQNGHSVEWTAQAEMQKVQCIGAAEAFQEAMCQVCLMMNASMNLSHAFNHDCTSRGASVTG